MCRSRTFLFNHPPNEKVSDVVGYIKEKCINDTRQISGKCKLMIKSLLGQRILCRKSRKYHKRGGKGFIQQQKEESKSNQTTS